MFFLRKNESLPVNNKRVIMIIGGSGVLGSAFLAKIPDNVLIINISRHGEIKGENVFNYHYDVLKNPEKMVKRLARIVGSVDVLIMMAYDHNFSSIEKLDRCRFLHEIELDTFLPMQMSMLCAKYFWSKDDREINIKKGRKAINISSGAAFGKTSRPELASYSGAKAALTIMTEYLHDYLFLTYGASAHIVAPGALQDMDIKEKTVSTLWELQAVPLRQFTLNKIF